MENAEKLVQAVMDGDEELAVKSAQAIIDNKEDHQEAISRLTEAMRILGRKFENFEIFLPEMIMSADAMTLAMATFEPILLATETNRKKGIVVLGTAFGDMHEIGKNIIKTVMTADGFDVIDLGKNVSPIEFVNRAKETKADIIAISALMTTTMHGASDVIQLLNNAPSGCTHKVIVGGAPTSDEWARRIGADGWAPNAAESVLLINRLMER